MLQLTDLTLAQLVQVKQQLEQEITLLTSSYSQLARASGTFAENVKILDSSSFSTKEGKEILVPLTSSLYVPGWLEPDRSVLVDVGTGYYVEKQVAEAKKYFLAKEDYVKGNMEKLQEAVTTKQGQLKAVIDVAQLKAQQQQQQQQEKQK